MGLTPTLAVLFPSPFLIPSPSATHLRYFATGSQLNKQGTLGSAEAFSRQYESVHLSFASFFFFQVELNPNRGAFIELIGAASLSWQETKVVPFEEQLDARHHRK